MYYYALILHSAFRWMVLGSLIFAVYKSYTGYSQKKTFSRSDNSIRHWTATIAHIQLIIGIILYIKSPVTRLFWHNLSNSIKQMDIAFFGLYHFMLMLVSVVLITIGSALAKRKETDKEKFKTMLVWFGLSLLIIFIAIPWPFSPLSGRPLHQIILKYE